MIEATDLRSSPYSRRRFFRWASSLAAAVGVAPLLPSKESLADSPVQSAGEDYYDKLGVAKIINAAPGSFQPVR